MFKFIKKIGSSFVVKVTSLFGVGVASAYAAVPLEVTTTLTDAKADAITVAGSVLGLLIAVAAFRYMRKGT